MTSQPPPSPPSPPSMPVTAPQPPAGQGDAFTKIRALGIVRPDEGRWAAGVAAGLAHRWGVDPVLVRGGFVALSLFFGVGLFVYGAAWLLLPHPDGRIHAQEVTHGTVTAGFVGSVIAILAGMPFGGSWSSDGMGFGWSFGPGIATLAVVGAVAWWLFHRHDRSATAQSTAPASPRTSTAAPATGPAFPAAGPTAYEPPTVPTGLDSESGPVAAQAIPVPVPSPQPGLPRPRPANAPWRPLTLVTLGLALLAGTLAHLASDTWVVAGAAGLAVVGVGLVLSGLAGRRGGLLVPVAIVLALTALNGDTVRTGATAGDQSWTPVTATQATSGFREGAGSTIVDLTSSAVIAGASTSSPVTVPISQGFGELTVTVPSGVAVRVSASSGAGVIDDQIRDRTREGVGNQLVIDSGTGSPVLVVTVQLGAGQIVIREAAPTAVAVPSA